MLASAACVLPEKHTNKPIMAKSMQLADFSCSFLLGNTAAWPTRWRIQYMEGICFGFYAIDLSIENLEALLQGVYLEEMPYQI